MNSWAPIFESCMVKNAFALDSHLAGFLGRNFFRIKPDRAGAGLLIYALGCFLLGSSKLIEPWTSQLAGLLLIGILT